MKKICFVTTVSITLKSFVLEFAKHLHNSGEFDVSFVCDYDEGFADSLPDYIHYYPIKMGRGINLDGFGAIKQMTKLFKKEKFDIVQYSTPNASLYAAIAAKRAKIKNRLYCQWGIAYVGFRGIKRLVFKTIEKLVCRKSTVIEPDSRSNLEFSIKEKLYKAEKGHVIWNGSASGVNFEKFDISKKDEYRAEIRKKHLLSEDAFVFGFVGRITGDKGINELFSAFKRLCESSNDVFLLMVGSEEKTASVDEALYDWARNSDRVVFSGYSDVVERYMSAMDCYVLPSYREGFGLGVVEAEAMGVPVIVTNIPGPIDAMIDGQTGIVVEKKDESSLHKAMEAVIANPDMMLSYAEKGLSFARESFEQKSLFEKIANDRKSMI